MFKSSWKRLKEQFSGPCLEQNSSILDSPFRKQMHTWSKANPSSPPVKCPNHSPVLWEQLLHSCSSKKRAAAMGGHGLLHMPIPRKRGSAQGVGGFRTRCFPYWFLKPFSDTSLECIRTKTMTGDAEICKSLWSCFIQGKSPFYFQVPQLLIRTCTLQIFTLLAQAR